MLLQAEKRKLNLIAFVAVTLVVVVKKNERAVGGGLLVSYCLINNKLLYPFSQGSE